MNIVVLCFDTLRADLVTDGADEQLHLPAFEALRRESVVFQEAFGEAEPTIPARRSFFTGRRQFPWIGPVRTVGLTNGLPGWYPIDPAQRTLAERLLDEGMLTGLVTDNMHMFEPGMNCARGFVTWDFIRGQECDAAHIGSPDPAMLAPYVREPVDFREHAVLWQYLWSNRGRRGEDDWSTWRVFTSARRWVHDNRDNGPALLWVDCFAPHEPWDPPPGWLARFSASGYAGKRFIFPGPALTGAERRACRDLYRAYLAFVDACLGRFLEVLRTTWAPEQTAIVLVSDHGTELDDDGQLGKGERHLHAYNTRINFWIHWPGCRPRVVRGLVQAHDLVPTLLTGLGMAHEDCDGANLWPFLRGDAAAVRDRLVVGWGASASVRDDTTNLIVELAHPDAARLYRVVPGEREGEHMRFEDERVRSRLLRFLETYGGRPLPWAFAGYRQSAQRPLIRILSDHKFPADGGIAAGPSAVGARGLNDGENEGGPCA